MSVELGQCEVCENEAGVGVAAVPGAPVSVVYGRECLANHAVPLWIADFNVAQCVPFDDLGWHHVAEWFRDQSVYIDGEYKRVQELTMRVGACTACGGTGEDAKHGAKVEFRDGSVAEHACLACYRGKVVTIMPEGAPDAG